MGILQARILEWVDVPSSKGSSQPRNQTGISCIAGGFFTSWAQSFLLNPPNLCLLSLSPTSLNFCNKQSEALVFLVVLSIARIVCVCMIDIPKRILTTLREGVIFCTKIIFLEMVFWNSYSGQWLNYSPLVPFPHLKPPFCLHLCVNGGGQDLQLD